MRDCIGEPSAQFDQQRRNKTLSAPIQATMLRVRSRGRVMLRLRAQITIDIEAADFVAAADHQHRVEDFVEGIRQVYSDASLVLKERRVLAGPREPRPEPAQRRPTGRLNSYPELHSVR
jgi:hypothetical protein